MWSGASCGALVCRSFVKINNNNDNKSLVWKRPTVPALRCLSNTAPHYSTLFQLDFPELAHGLPRLCFSGRTKQFVIILYYYYYCYLGCCISSIGLGHQQPAVKLWTGSGGWVHTRVILLPPQLRTHWYFNLSLDKSSFSHSFFRAFAWQLTRR